MRGLMFGRRSLENPATPLTSTGILSLLGGMPTDSGVPVTEEGSLAMSAVWRATSLISSLGGALPIHVYNSESQKVTNRLLDNPHPEMTPYELWKLRDVHRCLWGNAYCQKAKDTLRRTQWLYPISPWRVKVGKVGLKHRTPLNPTGKVFDVVDDDGEHHVLTPNEILHFPGLSYDGICGVSPIRAAAQAIGVSLAAEKSSAKLFGSGNLLAGILQTEQRLTQEQAETLQDRWRAKFSGAANAHQVAVLDSGAEFQSMTMPSSDAQMLEARDFQVTEIARFYGVPPYLLFQTDRSTSWGTAIEQQATGFVKFDLHPTWLAPVEQRITKELLLTPGHRAKYAIEGLLRGDTASRAEFYRVMREVGAFSANDIRELEDMPRIGPEGDTYLQPGNMLPLGSDPVDTTQQGAPGDPAPKKPGKKKPTSGGPKDGDGDGVAPE